MIEKWDAYDKYFNKIADGSLIRGEVIPDGVYHLVGEIIVKNTDGTYLLMQRDYKKPSEKKCPKCGGAMVEKGNKIVCMDEQCGYVEAKEKK